MTEPSLPSLLTLSLLASVAPAQERVPDSPQGSLEWTAERAEHLFNRAGFGASTRQVAKALREGPEATVDALLEGEGWIDEPFYTRLRGGKEFRDRMQRMPPDRRDEVMQRMRREEAEQLRDFLEWWMARMLEGTDDLRERMTLFWHGHFTSSMQDVKNSHEMILQNQLLRKHAVGNFGDIVHAIARDPAMLEYLDNDASGKEKPNENFARELMELFTLGEGNYTEDDVKEAARAFTGWSDRMGSFRFRARQHDGGVKTVLGTTGELDGDDVIEILLEQKACARYIAGKLLEYFEGVGPTAERLERYAGLLRANEFELAPLLRTLFLDPEFYRAEIVGGRVASPVDFLVGTARRLELDPPARLLLVGAASLGERLFYPPNVKGWEGGEAWITTGALMQRGNLAGVLLGEVELTDFLDHDPYEEQDFNQAPGASKRSPAELKRLRKTLGVLRELKQVERAGWHPRMNLSGRLSKKGAHEDREVVNVLCDALLAVRVDASVRDELAAQLTSMREEAGIAEGELGEASRAGEELLRRFAHLVLSLPEAQLH